MKNILALFILLASLSFISAVPKAGPCSKESEFIDHYWYVDPSELCMNVEFTEGLVVYDDLYVSDDKESIYCSFILEPFEGTVVKSKSGQEVKMIIFSLTLKKEKKPLEASIGVTTFFVPEDNELSYLVSTYKSYVVETAKDLKVDFFKNPRLYSVEDNYGNSMNECTIGFPLSKTTKKK